MYCSEVQVAPVVHTRLAEAVGAADSNSFDVHSVIVVQTRFELSEGSDASNCDTEHTVSPAQTLFDIEVGAAVSYWLFVSQTSTAAQTGASDSAGEYGSPDSIY
jgi:hypothetical protein